MRKLIELREGDDIPDGAKFITTKQVRGRYLRTQEYLVKSGWFSDLIGERAIYEEHTVYVYEVSKE